MNWRAILRGKIEWDSPTKSGDDAITTESLYQAFVDRMKEDGYIKND